MFAFATALSSCNVDEQDSNSDKKVNLTLYGTGEECESLSKTYLANTSGSVYFSQNDAISVFDGTYNNKFLAQQEGASSDFSGSAKDVNTYYILCPYQESATYTGGKITATVPSTQLAIKDTYDPQACLSVATCAKSQNFTLQNIGAIIRVITVEPFSKIVLKSIGGEPLVGTATINPSNATATLLTGVPEVELVPSNGSMIEAGTYYISLLPGTLQQGIEWDFYTGDGNVKVKKFQKQITVGRGKGLNCGTVSQYDETKKESDIEQPEQGGTLDPEEPAQPVEGLAFSADQYQKALWMTTRFYGAQRMGDGVNWLTYGIGSGDYAGGKSYLKDKDGNIDLVGGWADCGDYVLFGQTFYYSTYVLLLGYSEFGSAYMDKYDADYSCYINSGKYNWEDAPHSGNSIPDILDECKYATDWINKAVVSTSKFYYQKGHGDYDHSGSKGWSTSPVKSSYTITNGGEADGTRPIFGSTQNVSTMAALASASMSLMSRLYTDASYQSKCLEKAKTAYAIAKASNGNRGSETGGFYPSKNSYYPDLVIAAAELYRATKDAKYLNDVKQYINNVNDAHNWSVCYNNTEDFAFYEAAIALKEAGEDYSMYTAKLKGILDTYVANGSYLLKNKGTEWGSLRYAATQAFAYALYSKITDAKEINQYVLKTIEFIMGSNDQNFSFIVGFGDKSPIWPHIRNYYRENVDGPSNVVNYNASNYSTYTYRQLGVLVGGTFNGNYNDDPNDYNGTEGGVDYNAGLVGALAYICTFAR